MNRLTSLDFFRGVTVAAMIIVNDPGSWKIKYHQLSHVNWEGCTATDLIFPFFLFIVGVSVSLSYGKAISKGLDRKDLLWKAVKRSAIIFGIGLFLNLFPTFDFTHFRIPGVLQRIALVFVFCSFIFLYMSKTSQYYFFGLILVGYYIVMTFIPVPGFGVANLDPVNNFSAWFDRWILEGNIGSGGTGKFDSTGIFTTIPAIASGMVGVFVGHLLCYKKMDENAKLIWMFVAGCAMLLGGWMFSFEFPMIKKLWTSSFVLHSSGIALICFAGVYWFLDVLKYQSIIKPFLAFGVNALMAYVVAALFGKLMSVELLTIDGVAMSVRSWMYNDVLTLIFNPYNASFVYSILNTSLIFVLIWWMYKKNVIVKV